MIDQIARASKTADLIELRLDHLDDVSETTLDAIFDRRAETPWIATFRPKEQGGAHDLTRDQREAFWNRNGATELVDVEEDIAALASFQATRIYSHHDFSGVPD